MNGWKKVKSNLQATSTSSETHYENENNENQPMIAETTYSISGFPTTNSQKQVKKEIDNQAMKEMDKKQIGDETSIKHCDTRHDGSHKEKYADINRPKMDKKQKEKGVIFNYQDKNDNRNQRKKHTDRNHQEKISSNKTFVRGTPTRSSRTKKQLSYLQDVMDLELRCDSINLKGTESPNNHHKNVARRLSRARSRQT